MLTNTTVKSTAYCTGTPATLDCMLRRRVGEVFDTARRALRRIQSTLFASFRSNYAITDHYKLSVCKYSILYSATHSNM
jgi:hypothetical protein